MRIDGSQKGKRVSLERRERGLVRIQREIRDYLGEEERDCAGILGWIRENKTVKVGGNPLLEERGEGFVENRNSLCRRWERCWDGNPVCTYVNRWCRVGYLF